MTQKMFLQATQDSANKVPTAFEDSVLKLTRFSKTPFFIEWTAKVIAYILSHAGVD